MAFLVKNTSEDFIISPPRLKNKWTKLLSEDTFSFIFFLTLTHFSFLHSQQNTFSFSYLYFLLLCTVPLSFYTISPLTERAINLCKLQFCDPKLQFCNAKMPLYSCFFLASSNLSVVKQPASHCLNRGCLKPCVSFTINSHSCRKCTATHVLYQQPPLHLVLD